jgi:peroxiredoxin
MYRRRAFRKERAMASLKLGDPIIEFTLPGVDGSDHAAEDFAAKPALAVIFSCNHCPYAQAWEGRLVELEEQYGPRGAALVMISSNDIRIAPDDGFEEMKAHARERSFNFPYLYDESQEIARGYGAERTPEVFLFDGERKLRYHGAVDDNHESPEAVTAHYLRGAIEAVLAGDAVPRPETAPVGCTIKWAPE